VAEADSRCSTDAGPWPRALLWKCVGLAVAVLFLHWHTVCLLVQCWYRVGDYSYGFLVPAISLYLIWDRGPTILALEPRPTRWGFAVIAVAVAAQFVGGIGNIGYVQGMSLILLVAGIVLTLGGRRVLWTAAFPIAYLVLMVPLPGPVRDRIAFPLQLLATRVSADILELLGTAVAREGNVLHLAGMTLQVAEACSGIRSLLGLLTMGILLGYLVTPRLWERVILAVSTIPIAVVANILRVTGMGLLCGHLGMRWGQGFYHGFSGWLVFVFALAVLFIEASVLSALFAPREQRASDAPTGETDQRKSRQ